MTAEKKPRDYAKEREQQQPWGQSWRTPKEPSIASWTPEQWAEFEARFAPAKWRRPQ